MSKPGFVWLNYYLQHMLLLSRNLIKCDRYVVIDNHVHLQCNLEVVNNQEMLK